MNGRELRQGDLLLQCPVFVPSLLHPIQDGNDCDVALFKYDLIVVSQSCDLVEGQKSDVRQAILCPVFPLEQLKTEPGHKLANSDNRRRLNDFGLHGFHPLPECNVLAPSRPYSVVQFSQTFSLPIEYIRAIAIDATHRLRLISPYRELLAQRFGYFFGRIAINERLQLPK